MARWEKAIIYSFRRIFIPKCSFGAGVALAMIVASAGFDAVVGGICCFGVAVLCVAMEFSS